ncbi:hypothetical protein JOM49_005341 [Amycolatopsis magusensis]|uniref:Uncharacterized protein n=1 Tax=Amycolatopsis magusensis TaxID=882444 RepID=A0ABS4PY48_9PSEU|nr:hypothetical protein [Amycolatopsis magusensis]
MPPDVDVRRTRRAAHRDHLARRRNVDPADPHTPALSVAVWTELLERSWTCLAQHATQGALGPPVQKRG